MTIVRYPVLRTMRMLGLFLCLLPMTLWAQMEPTPTLLYRSGLSYQISSDPSWGRGYLVVTGSEPYSPAYTAGLQVGDIIQQIDGVPTRGLSLGNVRSLLERPTRTHLLTVTSLGRGERQVALTPEAKAPGAITERELARAFALYSLEDEQARRLSYPFIYHTGAGYDLSGVHTFSFAPSSPESKELETELYAQISRILEGRGLKRDDARPDLLLECFYELRPEEGSMRDASVPRETSRYDVQSQDFVRLPILPHTSDSRGSYSVHLSLQAVRPQSPDSLLWSCQSQDMLSEAMTLKDCARYTLPMMLQGFPFVPASERPSYLIRTSRYYYTGILYDASSLDRVYDVEDHSPAFRAGLRRGDQILQINGHRLTSVTPQELSSLYRSFVSETYRYRDTKQGAFVDARGVQGLSLWRKSEYNTLRKVFTKDQPVTAFAYLFSFRPYINDTDHAVLTLEIKRGGETYTLSLTPELRDESTISLDNN